MADNVTADPGSGGAVFATDEVGSAHYPYSKIAFGPDNTANIVSSTATNPLPVALSDTDNAVLDAIQAAVEGTLTVGSHAVTNAGTFAVQVDGDALTALQLIDDIVYVDDADWTALSSKHGLIGGVYQSTPGSITDGDTGPIRLSQNGAVHIHDGGNTITVDGTVTSNLSATDNAVLDQIDSNTDYGAVTGGGVEASALRVTLANDSTGVLSVDDNAGSLTIDNSDITTIAGAVSGTEMQVDVVAALPAGTNAIGKLAANSGVDIGDVDVTSIAAGSNLIGDVGIQGRTTGGLSIFYDNDLDETAVAVKASAGTLYSIHVINTTAAPLYLQLFDVAQGSVTVGTTVPDVQFVVPANADSDGAGFTLAVPQGIAFSTAITAACSTDSEGSSAPGANACHCNLFYK